VDGLLAAMIHSSVMAKEVRQSSAVRFDGLRQNGSDIAGFPLDSVALGSAVAARD
jgi:hypothetical protein